MDTTLNTPWQADVEADMAKHEANSAYNELAGFDAWLRRERNGNHELAFGALPALRRDQDSSRLPPRRGLFSYLP